MTSANELVIRVVTDSATTPTAGTAPVTVMQDATAGRIASQAALSVADAAYLLGLSRAMVQGYVSREELPSFKLGSRTLIARTDLDDWIARQPRTNRTNRRSSRLSEVAS